MTTETKESVFYSMVVGNLNMIRTTTMSGNPVMINVDHIIKAQESGDVLFISLTEGPPVKVIATMQMLVVAIKRLATPPRL